MGRFVQAYNTERRHSGLGFHTPADVHFGVTSYVDDQRLAALEMAWAEHPEPFGKNRLPKKMLLPHAAWINEPIEQEETEKNDLLRASGLT